MDKKKFSWKEVVNPNTMRKFKAIREIYNYWDKENKDISRSLETGFCIDKKGNVFPDENNKDVIYGTEHKIHLSSACKFGKTHDPLFGERRYFSDNDYDYEAKYALHSHPGFPGTEHILFTNRFSPEDLIKAQEYDNIPCLIWREESYEITPGTKEKGFGYYKRKPYENWYVKCHPNVPKERMSVIREYGRKFDYFRKKESRIAKQYKGGDILKLDSKEYEEFNDKIGNLHKFMKRTLDQYEKNVGVQTKKLFKYWYKGY